MAPKKVVAVVKKEEAAVPAPVETDESKKMLEIWTKLTSVPTDAERAEVAAEIAALVKKEGAQSLKKYLVVERIQYAAADKVNALAREAAMVAYTALVNNVGRILEPFLIPLFLTVLNLHSDKIGAVRTAAETAGKTICDKICPFAAKQMVPVVFEAMLDRKNWKTVEAALTLLGVLADHAPRQLALCLPAIIPKVSEAMSDSKEQVKKAAYDAMTKVCGAIGNRDIEQFIPALVSSIAKPQEVPDCVHKLSATTFVTAVGSPTLALMVPLLSRGLKERAPAIKRKSAVIIENMSKLIDDPMDAAPFLPKLIPGLDLVAKEAADPEIRSVATRAHKILTQVGEEGAAMLAAQLAEAELKVVILSILKDVLLSTKPTLEFDDVAEVTLNYIVTMCAELVLHKNFEPEAWQVSAVASLLPYVAEEDAEAATNSLLEKCVADYESRKVKVIEGEDDGSEDLCKVDFSLAYGGMILLNNTSLWLKRGRRYGLCGPNGCGKSTLMRAIANGQVDGFPPPEELKTVYVEHDLDASLAEMAVVDLVCETPDLVNVGREHVEEVLTSVGFTEDMRNGPVASLSGGWKMKLALARAILMKADILLLDEPTNHLDFTNVAWLENYLTTLKGVSAIIVSHDPGFLDHVCTDIIHYENRKLKQYRGNLSKFVEQKPEARVYYELSEAAVKFTFPEPGYLEGIKTKDKAFMKMQRVNYTYPGSTKQALFDITVQCSLSSRVAVIGPNGAGKSTLIKLLTGELEPEDNLGTVWKHPNMRCAYVAQHAFHHVEQHVEKTPNEYIRWRYAFGEDREEQQKVSRKIKEEEEAKLREKVVVDGTKKVVDCLLGRRKLKKSYEYEVQWKDGSDPTWMTRDRLEDMGFVKLVNDIDAKEAARMGLFTRPLTTAAVQKHLQEFGLEPEFGTHNVIRGLSGGQKVKVVLAAAMWNCPHLLVLDEPTNYLDRDSLGALAGAIKEYGGGVVMITHNREFHEALCPEVWKVDAGYLSTQGVAWVDKTKVEQKKADDEITDAFGNTVKVKGPVKKLSRKELKAKEKARKSKIAAGEPVSDEEEEDY